MRLLVFVGLQSGFTIIPTDTDEIHIPVVQDDAAASWTPEAGTISETDPLLDEVVGRPAKLAALVQFST